MASQFDIQESARETRESQKGGSAKLSDAQIQQLNERQQVPKDLWKPAPANLEAELEQQRQAEEERAQALEEQKQADRLQAQADSPAEQAKNLAVDYGKKVVKDFAKEEAAAAATTVGSAIVSTAPVWAPILGTIVVVIGLFVFIMVAITAACNQTGFSGWLARTGSYVASKLPGIPADVCAQFAVNNSTPQVPSTNTTQPPGGSAGDEANRKFLADHGIAVNKPYPTTSLAATLQSTLNEAVALKQGCDAWAAANGKGRCIVLVTGGSEDAHAEGVCSHANGYKLDFGTNSVLDAYIRATFKSVAPRTGASGGPQWINSATGGDYVLESNPAHWDMVVGCQANV